jgi:hypothetical protein
MRASHQANGLVLSHGISMTQPRMIPNAARVLEFAEKDMVHEGGVGGEVRR